VQEYVGTPMTNPHLDHGSTLIMFSSRFVNKRWPDVHADRARHRHHGLGEHDLVPLPQPLVPPGECDLVEACSPAYARMEAPNRRASGTIGSQRSSARVPMRLNYHSHHPTQALQPADTDDRVPRVTITRGVIWRARVTVRIKRE
jgi:hypothetical protein